MQEIIPKLEAFLTNLLKAGDFPLKSVSLRKEDEKTIKVEIFLEGAGLAIGENGENLRAWEGVLNQWLRKETEVFFRTSVDINNYRWQNDQKIRELAKKTAHEVMVTKKSVKLPPMTSYQRRVVHSELALHPGVATESEGQDKGRRVVVKPL